MTKYTVLALITAASFNTFAQGDWNSNDDFLVDEINNRVLTKLVHLETDYPYPLIEVGGYIFPTKNDNQLTPTNNIELYYPTNDCSGTPVLPTDESYPFIIGVDPDAGEEGIVVKTKGEPNLSNIAVFSKSDGTTCTQIFDTFNVFVELDIIPWSTFSNVLTAYDGHIQFLYADPLGYATAKGLNRYHEEITFRVEKNGAISRIVNQTSVDIPKHAISSTSSHTGSYDIDLSYLMDADQDYRETLISCSGNTPSMAHAGVQNVGCYQVNGKPVIRVQVRDNEGNAVNAVTTVNVKW